MEVIHIGYVERKLKNIGGDIVSTTDIARALGVDPSTIRRRIRANKLKAHKVGGVYHIRLGEAADYLKKYWIC